MGGYLVHYKMDGIDAYLDRHSVSDRDRVRPILAALPERELTAILLRFLDSLTYDQIAEQMGTTKNEVLQLLTRSLTRLRDDLH